LAVVAYHYQIGCEVGCGLDDFSLGVAGTDKCERPRAGDGEPPGNGVQRPLCMLQDALIWGARGYAAVAEVGLRDDWFDDVQQCEAGTNLTGETDRITESILRLEREVEREQYSFECD
jgi:hypothetical protein